MNFTAIDNVKFILFQCQIHIFIPEFYAKSATTYYVKILAHAHILITKQNQKSICKILERAYIVNTRIY